MWRTENCAKEWAGSICQSVLWANDGTASATSRADATTKRVVILDMAFLLLSLDDKRSAFVTTTIEEKPVSLLALGCSSLPQLLEQSGQQPQPPGLDVPQLTPVQRADGLIQLS